MLVQLSPWQKASTSITISGGLGNSITKRQGDKQGNNGASTSGTDSVDEQGFSRNSSAGVVASFVTTSTRRSFKKKKMASTSLSNFTSATKEDLVATLAITSAHRVSVLGRQTSPVLDVSGGQDEAGGEQATTSVFQESKQWQYTSRPGKSTSFFEQMQQDTPTNGKKSFLQKQQSQHSAIPQISAIMDARNNRIYALQNGNQTLSSWHATDASGPDDEFCQQQENGNRSSNSKMSSLVAKLSLNKPVVSLSLVPYQKGMVCGTYMDGAIFIAQWKYYKKERKEKLVLHNIDTNKDEDQDPKSKRRRKKQISHQDDVHIMSTVVVNKKSKQQTPPSNTTATGKRKVTSGDTDDLTITVNQIFSSSASQHIKLSQHEVAMDSDTDEWEAIQNRTAMLDLVTAPCNDKPSIVNVCQMDDSTLTIVYRWKHSDDVNSEYSYECTYISTERGQLGRITPFPLPPTTRYVCPLTSSILAVGTNDNEILFYDIMYGAVVHFVSVSEITKQEQEQEVQWTMTTDPKRGRLAILWMDNNNSRSGNGSGIQAAIANASLDGTVHRLPTRRNGYNLATTLRSFLATTRAKKVVDEAILLPSNPKNAMELVAEVLEEKKNDTGSSYGDDRLEKAVDRALDRLQAFHDQILDVKHENLLLEQDFFLKEYEASIISILSATNKFQPTAADRSKMNDVVADNPQEACPSKNDSSSDEEDDDKNRRKSKLSNGSSSLPENGMTAVRAYTPPSIPQRFIDGAIPIVLSTLLLPRVKRGKGDGDESHKLLSERVESARLDAGLILSRLLRSGKVSARLHLEPDDYDGNYFLKVLRAIRLSEKKNGDNRTVSPVNMIYDVLSYCPDVSEHLMVTMMSYGLSRASAVDMAENMMNQNSSSKDLCKQYLDASKDDKTSHLEALSYKLVKAGVTKLLKRIVTYSSCNETLIRNALRDGLTKDEAVLAMYFLANLLSTVSKEDTDIITAKKNPTPRTKTLTLWISALCDAHKDNLKGSRRKGNDEDEEESDGDGTDNPIQYVRQAVHDSLVQTEAVMALRDAYEHANVIVSGYEHNADPRKQHREGTSSKQENGPVPQYSVERLVF